MTGKAEAVIEALERLFGDTSVDRRVTLDDLAEIQAEVEGKINTLQSDFKKHRRER